MIVFATNRMMIGDVAIFIEVMREASLSSSSVYITTPLIDFIIRDVISAIYTKIFPRGFLEFQNINGPGRNRTFDLPIMSRML